MASRILPRVSHSSRRLSKTLSPNFFTTHPRPVPSIPGTIPSASSRTLMSHSCSSSSSLALRGTRRSSSTRLSNAPLGRRGMSILSDHSIYQDETPPPVAIKSVSPSEIELMDGLVLKSACIFLEGRVFLWEVPQPSSDPQRWAEHWSIEHFKIFEVVLPRPEILLLGTGDQALLPPPEIKNYLNGLGIQLDVMNTWNACSTYNLLAEEGRRVATALLPSRAHHKSWWEGPTTTASSTQVPNSARVLA